MVVEALLNMSEEVSVSGLTKTHGLGHSKCFREYTSLSWIILGTRTSTATLRHLSRSSIGSGVSVHRRLARSPRIFSPIVVAHQ